MLNLVFGNYVDGYGHKNGLQLLYISLGRGNVRKKTDGTDGAKSVL
jgi:hypothetical protein